MSDPSSTPTSSRPSPVGTLTFARAAYDAVVAHAREGAPEEVCGVLGGERRADGKGGDEAVNGGEASDARVAADGVRRVANVADAPRATYELDPTEQLEAMDAVEAAGRTVVGFYHSHPAGPPRPSPTDVARATWPGHSYVIVALDGEPFVGAWRWDGEGFVPERVAVARADPAVDESS